MYWGRSAFSLLQSPSTLQLHPQWFQCDLWIIFNMEVSWKFLRARVYISFKQRDTRNFQNIFALLVAVKSSSSRGCVWFVQADKT